MLSEKTMTTDVMDEMKAVRKRNREDYEALAKLTGKSIAEIEADTTVSDAEEEGDAA